MKKGFKVHIRRRRMIIFGVVFGLILAMGIAWKVPHRTAEIWSWTVGNKTIVIDAGHGGVDPGAVGKTKTLEKNVTLAIAKYLNNYLQQGGGKTVMIRNEDVDLGTSQGLLKRKREDLAQRLQIALDMQADVYLSIHANSFPKESLHGPQVFYFSDSPDGKILAQAIQEQLNKMAKGTRVAKGNKDLFILKKASQAAVTIEVGFLSNPEEEIRLNDSSYQQQIAWAIYQGVSQYFTKLDQHLNKAG